MRGARITLAAVLRRFAIVLALSSIAAMAGAQSLRRGVRVSVTQIDGGGGWSGTAFVSVPPSRLVIGESACGVSIAGDGRNGTGRIRTVRLELRGAEGAHAELPIGAGCPGATLVIGLDDGTELTADAGTVTTSLASTGDARGSFTATVTHEGAPLAIAGEITLAPRTP